MTLPVRILILDDDAATRRLLNAALTDAEQEVVTLSDGNAALELFNKKERFDLIITDLTLRRMDGLDFIRAARCLPESPPILVLSSASSSESVAAALECGADDFLQKPVDLRDLRKTVSHLLAHRKRMGRPSGKAAVRNVENGMFVELVLQGDWVEAERFQRFAERLISASLNEKERGEVKLALEEIVRNAIEWGNRNDTTKKLRLSYCLLRDRITFRIEDEGKGFNPAHLKDPSRDPIAHIEERRRSGKRMGGWGVFLTRKMVDEVTYNDKGNVVFMTKFLRPSGWPASPTEILVRDKEKPPRRSTRVIQGTPRPSRKRDSRVKEI